MNATLVAQFEAAVREHEILGMRDPQDHDAIEREFKEAKQALLDAPDEPATWLDRCAWAAMQGLLANPVYDSRLMNDTPAQLAAEAYTVAQAMLAEKRKREGAL